MTGIPGKLNVALPDGHLMAHVLPFLEGSGLNFIGYEKANLNRRPELHLVSEDVKKRIQDPALIATKVIRPQDMPTHVANANFDLAVSGTDWLREHKIRFPSSPVFNKLNLGFGKVKIVAAVHQDYPDSIAECIEAYRKRFKKAHYRIATEYVYIANHFARSHNLNPYKIIMTYGATESMIPEDCEMIVENTETGNTLRKNNLKIIDVIMASEGCLIASEKSQQDPVKGPLIDHVADLFASCLK